MAMLPLSLMVLVVILVFLEPLCLAWLMALCQRRSRGEKDFFDCACFSQCRPKRFWKAHKKKKFRFYVKPSFICTDIRKKSSSWEVFTCPCATEIIVIKSKKTQYSFSRLILCEQLDDDQSTSVQGRTSHSKGKVLKIIIVLKLYYYYQYPQNHHRPHHHPCQPSLQSLAKV